LLQFWRGAFNAYVPETIAGIARLKDAETRARSHVDLEEERRTLRSAVAGGAITAEAAVEEMRALRKRALAMADEALLADFEAARIRHDLPATFTQECQAVWPRMRERFNEALASFTKAIALVPADVRDDKRAVGRGGIVAHAWHAAADAEREIRSLWKIHADLREEGVLPTIPAAHPSSWVWLAPDRVPSSQVLGGHVHRVVHLRNSIAAGAGPSLVSFDELRARITAEAAAAAREKASRRVTSGPMYGVPMDSERLVRDVVAEVAARD
jgi:hypothetical protein